MSHSDYRAISPVTGTVILIGVVIILAALIMATTSTIGTPAQPPPTVDFEENQIDDQLHLTHKHGEPIDVSQLEIDGGSIQSPTSGMIEGGETIVVNLSPTSSEVNLIYTNGDQTYPIFTIQPDPIDSETPTELAQSYDIDYYLTPTDYARKNLTQKETLEANPPTNPFILTVMAPDQAGDTASIDLWIHYDNGSDIRMAEGMLLNFNENGVARVSIGQGNGELESDDVDFYFPDAFWPYGDAFELTDIDQIGTEGNVSKVGITYVDNASSPPGDLQQDWPFND